MIAVNISTTGISVDGHAGYDEQGKDIVCSAVTILVFNLIHSIEALTEDKVEVDCQEDTKGHIRIEFEDLSHLEGSIQWICQSPFRPHRKRKNWFVDVSIIPEMENICTEQEIRFERFHCSGKGGQNVNKVETGVRLTHIPTGIVVTSTAERTQQLNQKDALNKLNLMVSL